MNSSPRTRSRPPTWIAYAAITWWFAFALVSFYWAAGGTVGLSTLGEGIESLAVAGELWFTSLVAITGVIKLVPVVLVLSLLRPWGNRFSLTVRLTTVAGVGLLSFLYGGMQMAGKVLVLAGVFTPEELDTAGVLGTSPLWDPVWITSGILLCAVAWSYHREIPGEDTR